MSIESHITLDDKWFVGEEKQLKFLIVDADGAALDVSGYTLEWVLGIEGVAILTVEEANITISNGNGTNDAVTVSVDASDTDTLDAGLYQHSLRRIDDEAEQVLSYGEAHLQRQPHLG